MLEKFNKELINAMKDKDKVKLNTLRSVKGAMQLEVINNKKTLNDDLLISTINKQIKMRNDSIKEFNKGNRLDLVSSYEEEIKILKEYMPKELSLDEINEIIEKGIKNCKASSTSDLGLVMKEITPILKNRCDMKSVTDMIKEKLG